MAVTNAEQTYGDATIKTDIVLNSVEIISATEDGIFSMLDKTNAISTVHSYPVDTLATAGSIAVEQASDFTYTARTAPSLLTNIIQEFAIPIRVSQVQIDVQHYHGENELTRQLGKGLKEFSNGLEFDLVRGTLTSGVSGTAAKMMGIIAAISKSTNYTSHTSGTVFSATILDGLMVGCWTNSNGDVATDLYVGGTTKRIVDNFVQKVNSVMNIPDVRGIIRTVSTYETSMGTLRVHKHRYVDISGTDATGRILAINPQKLKFAFLHSPSIMTDLQRGGAYMPRAVYGSGTLETRNQDSNFYADGFLRTA